MSLPIRTIFVLFFSSIFFLFIFSQTTGERVDRINKNNVFVRNRRQTYYYMCGVYPFQFYSEYPCYYYDLCLNGGTRLGAPCSTSTDCANYTPNAVCYDAECCMQPIIAQTTLPPMTPTPMVTPTKGKSSSVIPTPYRPPSTANSTTLPLTCPLNIQCNCPVTKSAINLSHFYSYRLVLVFIMSNVVMIKIAKF